MYMLQLHTASGFMEARFYCHLMMSGSLKVMGFSQIDTSTLGLLAL